MQFNSGLDVNFQVFRTMVQESLLRERLMAKLSGFFGLLALVLASIGLYGLLSTPSQPGLMRLVFASRWALKRETFCR